MEGVSGTVAAGESFPPNWGRAASSLVHFARQRDPLVAGAVAEKRNRRGDGSRLQTPHQDRLIKRAVMGQKTTPLFPGVGGKKAEEERDHHG
ncbi:hypothetical protein GW17_00034645 [Ensete ventricosum]|nr:hypothetical protein GW17_00034645 [Ensete ventricosum]RZS21420.1 hypothetical protein BHM03_00054060 [Ensete ventricosum]